MTDHKTGMDHLLQIDTDKLSDETHMLLAKALTALKMSKPVNDRSREQITVARKEITQTLKRRFAA